MGSIPETPSLKTHNKMAPPVPVKGQITEADENAIKVQLEFLVQKCADLENHVGCVHIDDLLGAAEPIVSRATKQENVFLFIPNLIGYVRVLFILFFLRYMDEDPITAVTCYGISCLLDAFDGWAARVFDQCSYFGAVLDMVTDRCTTTFLFFALADSFPRYKIGFQFLCALDWVSHYVHMRATAATGKSHKAIGVEQSQLLSLYYTNRVVLFLLCFFNEAFFVALYMLPFFKSLLESNLPVGPVGLRLAVTAIWMLRISLPGMMLKQFINVLQLIRASQSLVAMDTQARLRRTK